MPGPPKAFALFDRDKVGIAKETYGFLEVSEDFQFNAPLKSENDQVEKIKLDQNVKLLGFLG